MSGAVVLLTSAAYVVPIALLALIVATGRRQPRDLVVGVLLVLPIFYGGHYLLLQAIQGWPSGAPLPGQFELLAFHIGEPRVKLGDPGRILLWVGTPDRVQPRVHHLPYSKAMHQSLIAAGQRQASGTPQIGRRVARPAGTGGDTAQGPSDIVFRNHPRPRLPAKETDLTSSPGPPVIPVDHGRDQ